MIDRPHVAPQSHTTAVDVGAARAELAATYLALRRAGRPDAALCVAHAGVFLLGDACTAEVREFADRYAASRPRRARAPLDDAAWLKRLHHSDDDPVVGRVFAAVLRAVRDARTRPLGDFGVSIAEAARPENSSVALVRALGTAAHALGVPMPLVFLRPAQPGGLAHVGSEPIASVAGAGALSGRSPAELTFLAGQHMAYYRPERYLRALLGPDAAGLGAIFLAALRAGDGDVEMPESLRALPVKIREYFERGAAGLGELRRVTGIFLGRGERADIPRWIAGADRTALRAGLLLCGDLFAARTVLAQLPAVPNDALGDLTAFAMSEDYFALRQVSGIALWADDVTTSGTEPPEPRPAAPSIMPPAMADVAPWPAAVRTSRGASAPDLETTVSIPAAPAVARVSIEDPEAAAATRSAPDRPRRALADLTGSLSETDWQELLADAAEHTPAGRLIVALSTPLRATQPRSPQDYGCDPALALRDTPAARALHAAATALGVTAPLVFALEEHTALFARPPCDPPVTLAHEASLAALDPLELEFVCAEHVAYFRPALQPRVLAVNAAHMLVLVRATVTAAATGSIRDDLDPRWARTVARVLQGTPGASTARELARSLAGYPGLEDDVLRWCEGAERAALRAAFACAPDRDAARRALARDRGQRGLLEPGEEWSAIEAFATSDAFARARARLGD